MKRKVEIVETDEGGLVGAIGQSVCLICGIYIYAGTLAGVNDDHVELADAKLVYDTGEWSAKDWDNAQELPSPWRVMTQGIESWGAGKC